MNNFDLKRMHTFDSHKKVSHPKIRSRFGCSFSNCELTTRLSDHIDLRIDSFHIVSAHAQNSLVLRYLREITLEGATFIRLLMHYTMEFEKR